MPDKNSKSHTSDQSQPLFGSDKGKCLPLLGKTHEKQTMIRALEKIWKAQWSL